MNFKLLLFFSLSLLCADLFAQSAAEDSSSTNAPIILADDPVLVALDSLITLQFIKPYMTEAQHALSDTLAVCEPTPAGLYAERMQLLNDESPMDLVYNETVQAYIDMYLKRKAGLTERVIGLSEHYYPLINAALDRHEMPLELRHLAVVESALNPQARSRAGAVGLWQFMYATGKIYDLQIDSYVDQRRDPIKATEAACEYLSFLHSIYDDWGLALAAYNAGPGNVNKAIRRSGGKKDYWEIKRWLPRETRGYVPAFIAVNYVMAHYSDHGLVAVAPQFRYHETDTVHVQKQVEFDQLSAFVGVEKEQLVYLNPVYRKQVIPATEGKDHLVLPRAAIGLFLANEDSIYGFEPEPVVVNGYVTKEVTIEHRIRSGEYLGGIADRYGVRVSELKAWNGIRGSRIYPGKVLLIHKTEKVAVADNSKPKAEKKEVVEEKAKPVEKSSASAANNTAYQYHIVQKGDTLWDIANKYDGVTVEQLRSLNKGVNVKRLNPGQKIKIGVQG